MLNPRSIPACGELFDIEMIDDPIHRSALACAGNSHSCWIFNINQSVHPRLRGELLSFIRHCTTEDGSSPLTRGTRGQLRRNLTCVRFIPAYAGNSPEAPQQWANTPVHPRLRGELHRKTNYAKDGVGSSPLTRGTHGRLSFWNDARPVHPRLRGELLT